MTIIDETTAIVGSTEELKTAVSTDNGIDYVYLENDITLDEAIIIYAGKQSLIIDGHYPPENPNAIHTFTDMDIQSALSTIGIRTDSNIDITFQNMIIHGRNYYSSPCIFETADTSGVTVTYKNITYTGPQIAFNPNGTTRFIDCDITVAYPSSPIRTQEVGEVCRVEFGGKVSITHNQDTLSTFWFRGEKGRQSLTVLENAEVTIKTNSYFMYNAVLIIVVWDPKPVAIDLRAGSSLSIETDDGFSYNQYHPAASLTIGENATLRYVQKSKNGTYHSLYLNGELTMAANSSLYMEANHSDAMSLIRFDKPACKLTLNNPKSFVVYSAGAAAFSLANQIPYSFKSKEVNYWLTPTAFPTAGTFADIPPRKWYKIEYEDFTWDGTVSSNATTVGANNFTPDDLAHTPAMNLLHLHNARVLSLGAPKLLPSPILDDGRPITGAADINAVIRAEYTVAEVPYTHTTTADNGNFTILTPVALPIDTPVKLSANIPFLIIEKTELSHDSTGLNLISAPELISFTFTPVHRAPLLLGRYEYPDGIVKVEDGRVIPTPWRLYAAIDGDLRTASGHILADAVVYKSAAGVITTLQTDTPIPVYDGNAPGITDCTWPPDQGLLLEVKEPIYNGERYSARISWTLEPT